MRYMRKYTDSEMYEEVNRKVLPLMRGRDTRAHTQNPRESGSGMDVVWGHDA